MSRLESFNHSVALYYSIFAIVLDILSK